jgi:hypothetical protein
MEEATPEVNGLINDSENHEQAVKNERDGTDVMILKIFSQKMPKILVLCQNNAKLCKNWIITLVFEKKAIFLLKNEKKIAENCDHNIDPRSG